jgi:hypothetical protein
MHKVETSIVWLSNFRTKLQIWIKNILILKERDGYVYLKFHIFSYIVNYVFNLFIFPLLVILNTKKSWICIEDMHCQFITSHSEC